MRNRIRWRRIQSYLRNGYNGGAWNGTPTASTGVITSFAAAGNASHSTAIGYADSADGQGVNTTPNTIELRYTILGDANLDGQVNSADLQRLRARVARHHGLRYRSAERGVQQSLRLLRAREP